MPHVWDAPYHFKRQVPTLRDPLGKVLVGVLGPYKGTLPRGPLFSLPHELRTVVELNILRATRPNPNPPHKMPGFFWGWAHMPSASGRSASVRKAKDPGESAAQPRPASGETKLLCGCPHDQNFLNFSWWVGKSHSSSSSREFRIRVPFRFSVLYFSRGTLPQKGGIGGKITFVPRS